jgi:hypothetical protein
MFRLVSTDENNDKPFPNAVSHAGSIARRSRSAKDIGFVAKVRER